MKRSTQRMLTTHTGSLPRPAEVVELLLHEQEHPGAEAAKLKDAVRRAVAEVVAKQIACGLDIINDGEQGRTDYTTHVKDRLTGFDGPSSPPLGTGEPDFPELSAMLAYFASPFQHRPACSGPVGWKDFGALESDITQAKQAMASAPVQDIFMTSPSPGQIARYLKNQYYPSDEAYLYALADVMAREYRAITDAGFILQLDCPDLALSRHMVFAHLSLEEFRKVITTHVEALNHAVRDIAPERMRMHICWASTQGPHHKDVPLKGHRGHRAQRPAAGGLVSRRQPAPRPRMEGLARRQAARRQDHHSRRDRFHLELRRAPGAGGGPYPAIRARGRSRERHCRVDCGFGTFAGRLQVDSKIVWMKLASLAEGARLASRELW
jgi:5-methyltetrahydropteroyltriglutamate--homocysteine methyltransferase